MIRRQLRTYDRSDEKVLKVHYTLLLIGTPDRVNHGQKPNALKSRKTPSKNRNQNRTQTQAPPLAEARDQEDKLKKEETNKTKTQYHVAHHRISQTLNSIVTRESPTKNKHNVAWRGRIAHILSSRNRGYQPRVGRYKYWNSNSRVEDKKYKHKQIHISRHCRFKTTAFRCL